MKSYGVTIQMKATKYFDLVMFIMFSRWLSRFGSVQDSLKFFVST